MATVHAEFIEGEEQWPKDRSLENTSIYWQAQEEPSKEIKREDERGESGQSSVMEAKGRISKLHYFLNTHSDISQYFLQCLLHSGS